MKMKTLKVIGIFLAGVTLLFSMILFTGIINNDNISNTGLLIFIILVLLQSGVALTLSLSFSIEKYKQRCEMEILEARYGEGRRLWDAATKNLKEKIADDIVTHIIKNIKLTNHKKQQK